MPGRTPEAIWNELDPNGPERVVWCRSVEGARVVVLLGAFDPPTLAHVRLAVAGARVCDAPAAFCLTKMLLARPSDVLLDPADRLRLLDRLAPEEGLGLAVANRGTYLDVHRAFRATGRQATFVIGSDKLAQLADPTFYPGGTRGVDATFADVSFLVVPRAGSPMTRDDVRVLDAAEVFDDPVEASISSTEVRRRLRAGEDVTHLVPPGVGRGIGGYTAAR